MTGSFSRDADLFDAAGCRVYVRPSAGRVPVRLGASAEETGLSDGAYRALAERGLRWFWLDPAVARLLLAVQLVVLRTRAPWRVLWSRRWARDAKAPPERIARRIETLQLRIARAAASRVFRSAFVATTALVAGAFLAAILAARVVEVMQANAVLAGLAAAAASRAAARRQYAPLGTRHPILSTATLAPLPVFAFAGAYGAHPLESLAIATSALGLLGWQAALYRDAPHPVRPSDPPPSCPHLHYSRARAPSSASNCQLIEGPDYLDLESTWLNRRSEQAASTSEPCFSLGGFLWPIALAAYHGIVLGVSGSGKTLTLFGVISALAPRMLTVVYDHKRTLYAAIVGALPGGEDDVALLFPLDRRGKAWAIARDVTNPLATYDLACWLTKGAEREDFWKRVGTAGLAAIFDTFNKLKPLEWTLLDVARVATPKLLPRFLEQSPEGRHFLETMLTSNSRVGDRPGDIIATISAFLSRLLPVALAAEKLHEAGRTFSIRDWERGATRERVIVFSHHPLYANALELYNQAIMSQIARALLGHPGRHTFPRALVVIDELAAAPEFDLPELLTNGREKGVTVWMATQDLPGLVERYGSREAADSLVGSVRHQVFLRTACDVTAAKASALAGTQTFERHQVSWQSGRAYGRSGSSGPGGGSSGWTDTETTSQSTTPGVHTEKLLPPHVLTHAPLPGPENGLVGYFRRDDVQWFPSIHWPWLIDQLPAPASIPDEMPIDVDQLVFESWTERDLDRLLDDEDDDDFFGDL